MSDYIEVTEEKMELDTSVGPDEIVETKDSDLYGDVIIEARDVKKHFKIFFDKGNQLKEKLLFRKRNRYEVHEVLKGVNFRIRKGEAWGLIGENGCGKSTTLKLLTRIMYPDSGKITIKGRVSSMLELGAGFHPDMSGRENIYTNAAIFGLTRKEIDEKIDDIIAFSELGKYIDNPVRTYSSGMYTRLAFSVAINVNAEILFIDEILAVGDANFQAKCFNRMREIKAEGTTIVIVSHNLGQIEQICNKTLWLENGKIKEAGSPRIVHPKYLDFMSKKRQQSIEREKARKAAAAKKKAEAEAKKAGNAPAAEAKPVEAPAQVASMDLKVSDVNLWEGFKNRSGNRHVEMTEIKLFDKEGKEQNVFFCGDDILLKAKYKVNKPIEDASIGFSIFRIDELNVYTTSSRIDFKDGATIDKSGEFEILLKNVNLIRGQYYIDLKIDEEHGVSVDNYRNAAGFEIASYIDDVGTARIDHKWKFDFNLEKANK